MDPTDRLAAITLETFLTFYLFVELKEERRIIERDLQTDRPSVTPTQSDGVCQDNDPGQVRGRGVYWVCVCTAPFRNYTVKADQEF